jgi:hypothetical protein
VKTKEGAYGEAGERDEGVVLKEAELVLVLRSEVAHRDHLHLLPMYPR